MKVVFVGPSLAGAQIDFSDICLRGPAVQGDIYAATKDGATHASSADHARGRMDEAEWVAG